MTSTISCLGIIMDGNRRWARARNLPVFEGHQEGYKKLEECLTWCEEKGIPNVVAYAFSTENWNRSSQEVSYLMDLFRGVLKKDMKKLTEKRVRVRFVGDKSRFDEDIQKLMTELENENSEDYKLTLHLLMSYGGRGEIVAATNALIAEGSSEITEESLATKLWSYPMPDPDLIIRTGGEQRLSNFLPWQSIYSELFFSNSFWPDFSREEFNSIIDQFGNRERRHGK